MQWEWQLHQHPVVTAVLVKLAHQRHEIVLGDVCGATDGLCKEADLHAVTLLTPNVGYGGRVFPHQDDSQAGGEAVLLLEGVHLGLDFAPNVLCDAITVDDFCGHFVIPKLPQGGSRRFFWN